MKILCITSSYPRDEQDISGIFVRRWREELEARGAKITLLTWRAPGAPEDASEEGVYRVPYAPRSRETLFYGAGAPENISRNPLLLGLAPVAIGAMLWRGARMLARERFDRVVGHWLLPGGWIARVLGEMFDVPSMVVTHSGGIDMLRKLPTPINKRLARFLAAGEVTFVSNEAKARFAASGVSPTASRILPMGFDAFDIREPAEGEDGSLERTILSLGRLVPIKGIDDLIGAVARVDLPGVSLHIAGDGPERERLEALALRLGVSATFHGMVHGEAKRRLLERSRLSIFASRAMEGRHEGLPVSFLECASAGAYPLVAELPGALPLLHDAGRQRLDPGRNLDRWAARIKEELASSERSSALYRARALAQRELVIPLSWERLGIAWANALTQPSTFSRR